ncbi:MAG: SCP2 sterol-binding domain-containing protein [Burkholderiales bacterium]|nr:SCP2 sterol-binding domain-containing protein [Burkholderiales bacterium]
MKIPQLTFPAPLAKMFSLLPQYPHSVLFTGFLNAALSAHIKPRDLQALHGKQVCIRLRDAGIEFHFSVTPTAFVARRRSLHPDLTISADARDFLLLGLRQEDADTLFFNRRLTLEGDTELGLFVKNTLDALEIPVLDIFRPGSKAAHI